jgi:hypothetical protein
MPVNCRPAPRRIGQHILRAQKGAKGRYDSRFFTISLIKSLSTRQRKRRKPAGEEAGCDTVSDQMKVAGGQRTQG